jgi:CheY-like chemotaxis protein
MAAANPPERNILIVEDDHDTRDLLATLLEVEGFETRGAGNGEEALESLRSQPPPDLILLDLMMPVMDGWEFRRRQKADPRLARIPVVVVSAVHEVGQTAVALSAAGYVSKPVEPRHLMATVRRLCC